LADLNTGKRTSFKAKLHKGQYERNRPLDSGLLDKDVTVTVKRVVNFRQLKSGDPHPANLEYLLFGSSNEPLAAHLITSPSDFDQIVAIKAPLTLTGADLTRHRAVSFPQSTNAQTSINPSVSPQTWL
jgi:hypothetical protein